MAIELHADHDPVARLRESRAEIFALARKLGGAENSTGAFPRSHLMRLLMGRHRGLLGGAAVALLVAKPRLIASVLQWAITQPLLRRIALPFILQKLPMFLGKK